MADLTQTPANVRINSTTQLTKVVAGETVAPGEPAYRLAADGEYYQAGASTAALAEAAGVFINYADDGDVAYIAIGGTIDLGATLAVGAVYVVSNTTGNIMPSSDLSTGEFSTVLGIATTTALLDLSIKASGVAIP